MTCKKANILDELAACSGGSSMWKKFCLATQHSHPLCLVNFRFIVHIRTVCQNSCFMCHSDNKVIDFRWRTFLWNACCWSCLFWPPSWLCPTWEPCLNHTKVKHCETKNFCGNGKMKNYIKGGGVVVPRCLSIHLEKIRGLLVVIVDGFEHMGLPFQVFNLAIFQFTEPSQTTPGLHWSCNSKIHRTLRPEESWFKSTTNQSQQRRAWWSWGKTSREKKWWS